jgi:hypothetical protein
MSKQRNTVSAQDNTRWSITMRDGAAVLCTGELHVTRKKSALIWYRGDAASVHDDLSHGSVRFGQPVLAFT